MLRSVFIGSALFFAYASAASANQLDSRFKNIVAPYQACSDVGLIDYFNYKSYETRVKELVNQYGSTKVQVLPPTGLSIEKFYSAPRLSPSDKDADLNPVSFLVDIGNTVSAYMNGSVARVERIVACFASAPDAKNWRPGLNFTGGIDDYDYAMTLRAKLKIPEAGPDGCAKMRGDVKNIISQAQSVARLELAMSIDAPNPAIPGAAYTAKTREQVAAYPWVDHIPAVNMYEAHLASVKHMLIPPNIPDLTPAERSKVEVIVKEFTKDYNPNLDRWDSKEAYGPLPLLGSFFINHRLKYYEQLQQVPVLAYIGETNLSGSQGDQKVFWAAMKLLRNANHETARLRNALNNASQKLKQGFLDFRSQAERDSQASWDLIKFLVYQNSIENALKQNPRRCAIATGLSMGKENGDIRFMIDSAGVLIVASAVVGVATPAIAVLGVSFTAAETTALLLGPPVGFAFTADAYFNYKRVEQASLNTVYQAPGQTTPAKPTQILDARDQFVFSVALEPLDFIGTGIVGKMAAFTAAKVGLRAEGMTAREMGELLAKAQSRDINIAKPARDKINNSVTKYITGIFGRTPTEADNKLIKTMANSGFLGSVDKPDFAYVEAFAGKVKSIPAADRDRVAAKATEIFDQLNAANVKGASLEDVVSVVESASRLGVSDSSQIAHTIENWNQGLSGLAKTYENAALKMSQPAFSKGSLAVRQRNAFNAALEEELEQSNTYKSMSESDRNATKEQLSSCGLPR